MVMESMNGSMDGSMKVNGEKIICMEQASISGRMADDMRGTILMIRSMGMASTLGQTVDSIKETGCTGNKMAKEPT